MRTFVDLLKDVAATRIKVITIHKEITAFIVHTYCIVEVVDITFLKGVGAAAVTY